jgi:hypothetical protein
MKTIHLKLDASEDRFEIKRLLSQLDMFEFVFQINRKGLGAGVANVVKLDGEDDEVDEIIEILAEENVKFVEIPSLVLNF